MAAGDSSEEVSVLIELNIPSPQVHAKRALGTSQRTQWFFPEESAEEKESYRRTIEEASHSLRELLGKTPRWLSSAHVFGARVTPEQLRTITRSPIIKTIRLNRRILAKP